MQPQNQEKQGERTLFKDEAVESMLNNGKETGNIEKIGETGSKKRDGDSSKYIYIYLKLVKGR